MRLRCKTHEIPLEIKQSSAGNDAARKNPDPQYFLATKRESLRWHGRSRICLLLYGQQDVINVRQSEFALDSLAFHTAELRSQCTRIIVLLAVFAGLLALVLIRGAMSWMQGFRGVAWPSVLLLAMITAYELAWLRVVKQAIGFGRKVTSAAWTANLFIESIVPAAALLLQIHFPAVGPHWALTSPAVLAWFLLIILSTLHLDPGLSRLAGIFSAAGYGAVCVYTFVVFPEVTASQSLLVYGTSFSYAALLWLGGFAAAAVAGQIRGHVLTALAEAEGRAKVEHDLGIARSIQQGLLPKTPPCIDRFDIAGWSQPADETGGDYFDWQQLADGRVAVTVADVTGHGIGPALGMTGCRAYARAGFATETDLQNFLARLNQLLYEDLPPEKFVTLAAGLLDPERATLQLISAGHGPLLFYSSAEDRFHSYEAQGPPLGLLPRFSYCCPQTLVFTPGDILILVTDGFVEWANADDEDFGTDRLKQVIRTYHEMPAAVIISELHSAAVRFAGPVHQSDDLTALVVKRVS